ncbi:hypothetical protein DFJ74DRAFT_640850 [Hyaloraphidium curvatum]|nr:hypothetical protein DFJ74DRAFT_640850 [Hyaloraphidium curvatum]
MTLVLLAAALLATLLLPGRASAQRRTGYVYTINVGPGGQHSFFPNYYQIRNGDTVIWTWESGLHNVVQVASNGSCTPIAQPLFKSDIIGPQHMGASAVFEYSFLETGTYYFASTLYRDCEDGMTGSLEVLDNVPSYLPPSYVAAQPVIAGALPG